MTRAKARTGSGSRSRRDSTPTSADRGSIERALSRDQIDIFYRALSVCFTRPDEAQPFLPRYSREDWIRQVLDVHDAIEKQHAESNRNLPPKSSRETSATYPVRLSPRLWLVSDVVIKVGLGHLREISTSWNQSFTARSLLALGQIARESTSRSPARRDKGANSP